MNAKHLFRGKDLNLAIEEMNKRTGEVRIISTDEFFKNCKIKFPKKPTVAILKILIEGYYYSDRYWAYIIISKRVVW